MNEFDDTHDDTQDDIEWVSKSEMKRDSHRLQAMGERLLGIKKSKLAKFPLNDELLAAIEESKRIKSNEAMRRHLQYIGKIMRVSDIEGIQRELDRLDPSSDLYLRVQNQAEYWREKLIKTEPADAEWFATYPDTDRQTFRNIVRAAKKEQPEDPEAPIAGGKNSKKLLKWIKEQLKK
ncbi:MAG: ribosome-associated protein [Reinekea sp.]|jgi:ribosome-associated protein